MDEKNNPITLGRNKIFTPGRTIVGNWGNGYGWGEVILLSGHSLQEAVTKAKGVRWRAGDDGLSTGCYVDWQGRVIGQEIPSWEYGYSRLIEDLCVLYRITIQQEQEWLWLAEAREKTEEVTGKERGRLVWAGSEARFPGLAVCYLYLLVYGRIDER